jgi:hypothetical protein
MKIRDLTESGDKHPKLQNKNALRCILSVMLNTIKKLEINGNAESKNDREKIEIIKDLLSNMIKDYDQKQTIKGVE